ncbi:unnamed protein product, partial [Urochloa humidicola]
PRQGSWDAESQRAAASHAGAWPEPARSTAGRAAASHGDLEGRWRRTEASTAGVGADGQRRHARPGQSMPAATILAHAVAAAKAGLGPCGGGDGARRRQGLSAPPQTAGHANGLAHAWASGHTSRRPAGCARCAAGGRRAASRHGAHRAATKERIVWPEMNRRKGRGKGGEGD